MKRVACVLGSAGVLLAVCWMARGEPVAVESLRERVVQPVPVSPLFTFRFERAERIDFAKLPTLYLFRYIVPCPDGDMNLWLFAADAGEGQVEVLLDETDQLPGCPPAFECIETEDGGDEALVRVHARVQGNGNYWVRKTYRYTGESLELAEDLIRKGGHRFAFNEEKQQYDTLHPVEWEGATVRFRKEGGDE